tara:strand:- start:6565 stop:6774 length:210 start_codon:yes stop_codon:yes gene_type:complete
MSKIGSLDKLSNAEARELDSFNLDDGGMLNDHYVELPETEPKAPRKCTWDEIKNDTFYYIFSMIIILNY